MNLERAYYPVQREVCHHFFQDDGCVFCFFTGSSRCQIGEYSVRDMTGHFDTFVDSHRQQIQKHQRIIVAVNGSWFPQVHSDVRHHIDSFCARGGIQLVYELRATMLNSKKRTVELTDAACRGGFDNIWLKEALNRCVQGEAEIRPGHTVMMGLEVADDDDLLTLNKTANMNDYLYASKKILENGGRVGGKCPDCPAICR